MALTNGIIASSNCHNQNCAKSKQALRMEVIGGFALPLLVTVGIYLYRWNNRAMIRSLNRNFKTIYHSQHYGRDGQWQRGCWERNGRLATKQVFEVMALAVLYINSYITLTSTTLLSRHGDQLFLCYRQMSRTTSDSVNMNQLGQTLLPMLSAIASAGQIMFLVDIGADFNRKVTTLSMIVNRIRDGTDLYGYFDLDRSLIMTAI
uniref:Uncharacterized protein n=1 Tax=Anopheles culicifacies TaxID=139723 RepID=A0A182LV07_9DIPT